VSQTRLPKPNLASPFSVPSLRWGAVGAGSIVSRFVNALHTNTGQRMHAIAARNAHRTAALASELGVAKVHDSVEALVEDPGIEVVYIATPASLHREHAQLAIAAGKHVLVEKPFAMNAVDGQAIADAARAAGVLVMEAMWTRYLPQSDVVRQSLRDGVIGDVHLVCADFGFVAPTDPHHRLWDVARGGGALLDVGIYPISFASSILGPPATVSSVGSLAETGVDTRAAVQLTHASGALAQLAASIVSATPTRALIVGSTGRLEVVSQFIGPSGVTLSHGPIASEEVLEWSDDSLTRMYDGLSYQATALASYVGEGRTESPLHTLNETVSILATIDEARRQVVTAHKRRPAAGALSGSASNEEAG
jgi:predicted dehydrogenase